LLEKIILEKLTGRGSKKRRKEKRRPGEKLRNLYEREREGDEENKNIHNSGIHAVKSETIENTCGIFHDTFNSLTFQKVKLKAKNTNYIATVL